MALTKSIIVSLKYHIIMVRKAIIKGKVVRIANIGRDVEFDVSVHESVIGGKTFTIGTVVTCVARLDMTHSDNFIIHHGHCLPTPSAIKEPLKTAMRLALGDEVEVTFRKIKGGWAMESIVHKPKKGQDVREFLNELAKLP